MDVEKAMLEVFMQDLVHKIIRIHGMAQTDVATATKELMATISMANLTVNMFQQLLTAKHEEQQHERMFKNKGTIQ